MSYKNRKFLTTFILAKWIGVLNSHPAPRFSRELPGLCSFFHEMNLGLTINNLSLDRELEDKAFVFFFFFRIALLDIKVNFLEGMYSNKESIWKLLGDYQLLFWQKFGITFQTRCVYYYTGTQHCCLMHRINLTTLKAWKKQS